MSARDKKIIAYLTARKESYNYFLILDMRLFEETDCPLFPEDVSGEDLPILLDLYTHLEEYEKCQVLHLASQIEYRFI